MIAIAYDKAEILDSITATIPFTGIAPETINILGLAFAKRMVPTSSSWEDEGFEPPFNPVIYLVYDDGGVYNFIRLQEPVANADLAALFEPGTVGPVNGFNRVLWTNKWDDPAAGAPSYGDFYDDVSFTNHVYNSTPPGFTATDLLEYSGHPSYNSFGFAFFPYDQVRYFLTTFMSQPLILSGATSNFGLGISYYHPREFFTLKLEISDTPQNIANESYDFTFFIGGLSSSLLQLINNWAGYINTNHGAGEAVLNGLVAALNTACTNAGNNAMNARNEAGNAQTQAGVARGSVGVNSTPAGVNAVNMAIAAGNVAAQLANDANAIANAALGLPSSPITQASGTFANYVADLAANMVIIAIACTRAAGTAGKAAIRSNPGNNAIRNNANNNIFNAAVGGVRLNEYLSNIRTNEIRTAKMNAALAMETALSPSEAVVGEPMSIVGPSCPPWWRAY